MKNTRSKYIFLSILCLFLVPQLINAQNTEQMWLEYKPTLAFKKDYKLAMRGSFRTNFVEPRWRTFEVRLMPEKKLTKHFDIVASLSFLETLQYESFSTTEIRPALGARFHFLPGRRVSSGLLARVEFRNIYEQEAKEWTYTTRPRLRIFASIPLNEKSMSLNNVLYATSYFEFFYQNDEDVQERYANRYWIRLGLGYKLNKKIKFELLYNRQDSKNTIDTSYEELTNENIFVFSFVHKLN